MYIKEEIGHVLKELGIPTSLLGYKYAKRAIELVASTKKKLSMTKEIYPTIAKEYDATSSRVERAIRHAIDIGWCRGNPDMLYHLFRHSYSAEKGRPTNSEFITAVAEFVVNKCSNEHAVLS